MSSRIDPDDQDMPMGRITFDELGNAVWQPATAVRTEQTLNRILKTDRLSIEGAERRSTVEHGYDPYRSGPVGRDGPVRRKKDLRALSEWVRLKKRMEAGG